MGDVTRVEVQSEDAAFLFGRFLAKPEALRLVTAWAAMTGRPSLEGVKTLDEAAQRVGVDEFRQFVLHASGGFGRVLELHEAGHDVGEMGDEERAHFEALKPPQADAYAVLLPDFGDPYMHIKIDTED